MPRVPTRFKQRDLTRALKAAQAAGYAVHVARVEPDGAISLLADKDQQVESGSDDEGNPWDTL